MSDEEKKETPDCYATVDAVLPVMTDKGPAFAVHVTHHRHAPKAPCITHKGPANVTTDDYRESWDRIFGGKAERGQA